MRAAVGSTPIHSRLKPNELFTGEPMTLPQTEILNTIVGRIFRIDDITTGDPQHGYLVRYHGTLLLDSVQAGLFCVPSSPRALKSAATG